MNESIGADNKSLFDKFCESCSPYWFTSTLVSRYLGGKGRKEKEKEAMSEKKLQEELRYRKYSYEDAKEVMEFDFRKRMKDWQSEDALIEKKLKSEYDSQKYEVKMFIKGWPLQLSLPSVLNRKKAFATLPESLHIIIAKHTGKKSQAKDMLTVLYDGNGNIVDNVSSALQQIGIPSTNILHFIDNDRPGGGAALANIYSMMSLFPTLVILPRLDLLNKKLRISIGFWSPSVTIPSQQVVFVLDYDEMRMQNDQMYKEAKQNEIETAYISLCGVMNDAYRMSIFGTSSNFIGYAKSHLNFDKYPYILDYIRKEYSSMYAENSTNVFIDGQKCLIDGSISKVDVSPLIKGIEIS